MRALFYLGSGGAEWRDVPEPRLSAPVREPDHIELRHARRAGQTQLPEGAGSTVFLGAALPLPVVWAAADIANALMAIPNLLALLALSGVVVHETRRYLWEGRLDERAGPD